MAEPRNTIIARATDPEGECSAVVTLAGGKGIFSDVSQEDLDLAQEAIFTVYEKAFDEAPEYVSAVAVPYSYEQDGPIKEFGE